MKVITLRITIAVFILFSFHSISAQELASRATPIVTAPPITAAGSAERVRFTAPSNVVRMQLQVISETGQVLFEVSSKGNVLDWTLQDSSGQRLQGSYLTMVTVKSLAGRVSERIGSVSVAEQQVELSAVERNGLTAAQQQAVGPMEEQAALTILKADEGRAVTVLANNGGEGQVIRERGALSFRRGDFYAGKDTEQMRLTEEGNLGLGTDKPQAKLDVAGDVHTTGTIRASKGIEFADGTVQTSGLSGRKDSEGNLMPNVAGTGTQNQLAKWTETGGAGTLGDSAITESGGNLGVGITNPGQKLHVVRTFSGTNPLSSDRIAGFVNDGTPANHAVLAVIAGSNGVAGIDLGDTQNQNQSYVRYNNGTLGEKLRFGINNADVLLLQSNGNVGIGTTTPTAKLHVEGNGLFTTLTAGNVNFTGLRTEEAGGFPNVIGGDSTNSVTTGVIGATIGGGGDNNTVTDTYGTVAGGTGNRSGDNAGALDTSSWATVGGGSANVASGSLSTVGGGDANTAGGPYSTVSGGSGNVASGSYATVPGGSLNIAQGNYSFAAGQNAQASHQGSFVWSDSTTPLLSWFASTANDQFLINATGGVGIGTNNPTATLHVSGSGLFTGNLTVDTNTLSVDATNDRVGIGTNAPGYRLDVVGRSRIKQDAGQTGGTGSAGLWLFQNTPAADRAFVGMETDNSVGFFGNNGGGWGLIMNTQTGDVGIGTSAPDAKLSVNGQASKPGGGSWNVFSDERLKNIKGRFATGLNAVMKLKPLRYEYKNDNALALKSEGEYIGFSAQAVQKVIPEAVTKNAQGYLLVNNDPIMWTMLNAIKEQQTQIEQQREQLKQQQAQVDALRKLVCGNKPAQMCANDKSGSLKRQAQNMDDGCGRDGSDHITSGIPSAGPELPDWHR